MIQLGNITDSWREEAACEGRTECRITKHAGRYDPGDTWSACAPTQSIERDRRSGLLFPPWPVLRMQRVPGPVELDHIFLPLR